jgi:hypothetical protein
MLLHVLCTKLIPFPCCWWHKVCMSLLCGLHRNNTFVYMLCILNMIPTRNRIVNADESFLVHHFKEGNNLQLSENFWAVCSIVDSKRTHRIHDVKLEKSVIGWRHLQESHWLGLLSKSWLHHQHDVQLNWCVRINIRQLRSFKYLTHLMSCMLLHSIYLHHL